VNPGRYQNARIHSVSLDSSAFQLAGCAYDEAKSMVDGKLDASSPSVVAERVAAAIRALLTAANIGTP